MYYSNITCNIMYTSISESSLTFHVSEFHFYRHQFSTWYFSLKYGFGALFLQKWSPVAEQKLIFTLCCSAVTLQVIQSSPLPVNGRTSLTFESLFALFICLWKNSCSLSCSYSKINWFRLFQGSALICMLDISPHNGS